jgi:alkaline phosphatase D
VITSRSGRTKTAPIEASNQNVRFGVICCQSYSAGHYHVLWRLAQEELDFVVHLGDYVYETAEAPPYVPGAREVVFGRPEEAQELSPGRLSARSLDNYRDLYRTYRSDPDLQALHERFAMIAIPDDHEFADDSHGATTTYSDGRADETDTARREAADRAWAEYMPVDFETSPATRQASLGFPEDLSLFRSFTFGRHLTLVMTDLRRYRPDHLVPENALPGSVFATELELHEIAVAPGTISLIPYVEIDSFEAGTYQAALRARAAELDLLPESIAGKISVPWINSTLEALTGELPPPIDETTVGLERGLAFHQLLKTAQFSRLGCRYLVEEATYGVYAQHLEQRKPESQNLLGTQQRDWFLETLAGSTSTFKVWCSEIVLMPRVVDLGMATELPEAFRSRVSISAEDWGGFPNERDRLLRELFEIENSLILSGDLHCFFAGVLEHPSDPTRNIVELTTSSVSSTTWLNAIRSIASNDPSLSPGAAFAVGAVGSLLQDRETRPNPHLAFQDLESHGCSVIEVGAEALEATLLMIAPDALARSRAEFPMGPRFRTEKFRVRAGSGVLERELEGVYYRWDSTELAWITDQFG